MSDAPAEGAAAPIFSMPVSGGGVAGLSDYSGKRLILFFYPRDDTPGCTTAAKGFSELADRFESVGAALLGVSRDTIAKHEKFIAKHNLQTPLASDEDGGVCEDYGVWVEKNMYGRTSMGIARTTFLIGADGVIEKVWKKVKPAQHPQEVLEWVTQHSR